MIALNGKLFANAFRKARTVRPAVNRISESEFSVLRSDGTRTPVVFFLHGARLWAQCGCYAGNPAGRRAPLPCYHVAACLLFDGGAAAPAPEPAPTLPTIPARTHTHLCGGCNDTWRCGFHGCEGIENVHCDTCELTEADRLDWQAFIQ